MVFLVILEFHEFYHFNILGKSKVISAIGDVFHENFDNILHFPTSATQTLQFIESTVEPLLFSSPLNFQKVMFEYLQ